MILSVYPTTLYTNVRVVHTIVSIAYEAYVLLSTYLVSEEHISIVGWILKRYPILSDMSVHLRAQGDGVSYFSVSVKKDILFTSSYFHF